MVLVLTGATAAMVAVQALEEMAENQKQI